MARNNLSRGTDGFSLARMRDVVTDSVDKLTTAMSKQGAVFDTDAFENDLRALVLKYFGKPTASSSSIPDPYFSSASAVESATVPPRPNYNLAADILISAHQLYVDNNVKEAIQMMANVLEADGIQELISALEETNLNTDVSVLAALAADEQPIAEVSDSHSTEASSDDADDSTTDGSEDDEPPVEEHEPSDEDDIDTGSLNEEEGEPEVSDFEDEDGISEADIHTAPEVSSASLTDPVSDEEMDDIVSEVAAKATQFRTNKTTANTTPAAQQAKPAAKPVTAAAAPKPLSREERAFLNKISLSGDKQYRTIAKSMETEAA